MLIVQHNASHLVSLNLAEALCHRAHPLLHFVFPITFLSILMKQRCYTKFIWVSVAFLSVLFYCESLRFWETRPLFLTVVTHTSGLLLKLCGFLSVCYRSFHKPHWLVHVTLNPVNHSALTRGGTLKEKKPMQWGWKREEERREEAHRL